MIAPAVWTLVAAASFGLSAPRLSRPLPPAVTTWLLSAGGALAAAASTSALALLAFRLVAQTDPLTAQGHWSSSVLASHDALGRPLEIAALVTLAVLLVAAARCCWVRLGAARHAYRLARAVGGGELAVVHDPAASALAVPGRPGRIVVTSGLLQRLDGPQRRALLAHERSHLRHRHHVHQSLTDVATALNPLLRPLRPAVRLACERWADEDAARAGARRDVCLALAHAATAARPASSAVLAAAGGDVVRRIAALEEPAPRLRAARAALPAAMVAIAVVAVGYGMVETERLFELAQTAWSAAHH